MPLPTPFLDDRHFQDIVDQAKRLIPHYCPEWTDHNVSDPGVTLIELFAWMTDLLLYRVNQVPDKNYVKFLEMIGVQLEEARAATAPITFYLSAAQETKVTMRAPQMLRTRTRAVTTDDYEHLAAQVEGVARACCLAPGAQPGPRDDPRPGQIVMVVLPQFDNPQERIPPEQLVTSAELRSAVLAHLDARRLLGVSLEVRQPQYTWISVRAELRLAERSDPALISEVQQQAEEALYRYLNPYIGGPHGDGWPFGRPLNRSELYSLLHRIEHVEFVEDVQISINESPGRAAAQPLAAQTRSVNIPRYGLVCSDRHQVKVS